MTKAVHISLVLFLPIAVQAGMQTYVLAEGEIDVMPNRPERIYNLWFLAKDGTSNNLAAESYSIRNFEQLKLPMDDDEFNDLIPLTMHSWFESDNVTCYYPVKNQKINIAGVLIPLLPYVIRYCNEKPADYLHTDTEIASTIKRTLAKTEMTITLHRVSEPVVFGNFAIAKPAAEFKSSSEIFLSTATFEGAEKYSPVCNGYFPTKSVQATMPKKGITLQSQHLRVYIKVDDNAAPVLYCKETTHKALRVLFYYSYSYFILSREVLGVRSKKYGPIVNPVEMNCKGTIESVTISITDPAFTVFKPTAVVLVVIGCETDRLLV